MCRIHTKPAYTNYPLSGIESCFVTAAGPTAPLVLSQ